MGSEARGSLKTGQGTDLLTDACLFRPQVISHQNHLLSLLNHSTLLQARASTLAEGSNYLPPTLPGKRTRARAGAEIGGGAGGGSGATAGGAPTPVKKRKVGTTSAVRDEDDGGRHGRGTLEPGKSPKLSAAVPRKGATGPRKKTMAAYVHPHLNCAPPERRRLT